MKDQLTCCNAKRSNLQLTNNHKLANWRINCVWCNIYQTSLTVKRFFESTSIIPRSRFWQSGGTKCGMWNTPRFTFSSSWRRLSSSNGKAPYTPHLTSVITSVSCKLVMPPQALKKGQCYPLCQQKWVACSNIKAASWKTAHDKPSHFV